MANNLNYKKIKMISTQYGMVAIPETLAGDVEEFHYSPVRREGDFFCVWSCGKQ